MKPSKSPCTNANYPSRLFHLFAYTINCCCLWVYTWQHLLPFIMLWSVNELATIQWFSPFSQCLFKKKIQKKNQLKKTLNPVLENNSNHFSTDWDVVCTLCISRRRNADIALENHEGKMVSCQIPVCFGRVVCKGPNPCCCCWPGWETWVSSFLLYSRHT